MFRDENTDLNFDLKNEHERMENMIFNLTCYYNYS